MLDNPLPSLHGTLGVCLSLAAVEKMGPKTLRVSLRNSDPSCY